MQINLKTMCQLPLLGQSWKKMIHEICADQRAVYSSKCLEHLVDVCTRKPNYNRNGSVIRNARLRVEHSYCLGQMAKRL
jgi:hypothetical protein